MRSCIKIITLFLCINLGTAMASYQFVTPSNIFSGETAVNLTVGAPLSVSSTGKVTTGIANSSVYVNGNFTCTTTDQVVTGATIAAPVAGTYLVSMSGDINSAVGGVVATVHIENNGAANTNGNIKTMPFAGGTLTAGNQRVPFAKTIITALNGTNAIEVWCSTSSNTVTVANTALTIVRLQ